MIEILRVKEFALGGKGSSMTSEDLRNMIPQEYREFRADVLKEYDVDGESLRGGEEAKDIEIQSDSRFGKNLKEQGAKKLLEVAFSHPIKLIANALGVPPKWMLTHRDGRIIST